VNCPDCKKKLIVHTLGDKAGRGHCNECGVCWPEFEVIDEADAPKRTKKVNSGAND
jgi:transcription elongation factor Elf1